MQAALDIGVNFGASGSKSYQRVSTNLIKVAEKEQNIPRGKAMKLATGTNTRTRKKRKEKKKKEKEKEEVIKYKRIDLQNKN